MLGAGAISDKGRTRDGEKGCGEADVEQRRRLISGGSLWSGSNHLPEEPGPTVRRGLVRYVV